MHWVLPGLVLVALIEFIGVVLYSRWILFVVCLFYCCCCCLFVCFCLLFVCLVGWFVGWLVVVFSSRK